MDDIVKDFLTGTRQLLDWLDAELVRLQAGTLAPDSLSKMVRSLHSINATCGFLGFPHIERVTRAGECLLTRLQEGQLSPAPEIGAQTSALVAALRQMLREIENNGHDGENDYPDLLARLNRTASAASATLP